MMIGRTDHSCVVVVVVNTWSTHAHIKYKYRANVTSNMHAVVLLLLICAPFLPTSSADDDAPPLLWSATGGGWRSHFACVGFANLFGHANAADLDVLSRFDSVATNSGASWFAVQLFYSGEFYDRVVSATDGAELHDFVVEWMDAYNGMLVGAIDGGSNVDVEEKRAVCGNLTGSFGEDDHGRFERLDDNSIGFAVQVFSDLCNTLVYFDGDWAAFTEAMLASASKSYGK